MTELNFNWEKPQPVVWALQKSAGTKVLAEAGGQTQRVSQKDPVWSDLPLHPVRTGDPAQAPDLTFGTL